MLTHRGFAAWIQVEGKIIPEFLVAVDEKTHRVSCWIVGNEGQTFTVYWQDEGGDIDTCSFIILDGLVVPGRFLFGAGIASRSGVRTSMSTERPFMFQKVEAKASGNASSPTSPSSSKETGMIILKIKRIRRVSRNKTPNRIEPSPKTVLGKRKPGDLCIGFGEEIRVVEQESYTYDVVNHENPDLKKPSSYVTFVFRYRSADFLEAQGITIEEPKVPVMPRLSIPPTPSMSMPATPRTDMMLPPTPKSTRIPSRRISTSLPPLPRFPSALAEESEESSTDCSDDEKEGSPTKRLKVETSLEALFPPPETLFPERTLPLPTSLRRPSAELRRAASWTDTELVAGKDGVYRGDGEFFLARHNREYAAKAGLPYLADFKDMIVPGQRVVSRSNLPLQQQPSQSSQESSSSSHSTESNPESPFTDVDDSFTSSK